MQFRNPANICLIYRDNNSKKKVKTLIIRNQSTYNISIFQSLNFALCS